ncbi:helix-turn-helix transcriptional regulator [Kitasatospora setae]|nr:MULTISPECIES: helix-turn-helix transcriptional regulator [Kitasatospora]
MCTVGEPRLCRLGGPVPDSLWSTPKARSLAEQHRPGELVRLGRQHRDWTLEALERRLGVSPSTVSRLERANRIVDLALLRQAAIEVGMPRHVLVTSLALGPSTGHHTDRVAGSFRQAEESPMRRRTLVAAATVAGPAALLLGLDDALADTPGPTRNAAQLDQVLNRARDLFDTGAHARLLEVLPGLIADAHAAADSRRDLDQARLSTVYSLATAVLIKTGHYDRARLTADRARTWAEVSGSPLAQAAATREAAVVLRHQDRAPAAQRLMLTAVDRLENTGLTTQPQTAAYAQLLCTLAYTAAVAGQRTEAVAMMAEARNAARRLPATPGTGSLFTITPAAADLYAVSVHWALGDAGAALEAGRNLRPEQFPTAERRARLHTDLARAWWQWGRPEQTANELLSALRASPAEIRDRSSIRAVVSDLVTRHPRAAGVRELAAAVPLS